MNVLSKIRLFISINALAIILLLISFCVIFRHPYAFILSFFLFFCVIIYYALFNSNFKKVQNGKGKFFLFINILFCIVNLFIIFFLIFYNSHDTLEYYREIGFFNDIYGYLLIAFLLIIELLLCAALILLISYSIIGFKHRKE